MKVIGYLVFCTLAFSVISCKSDSPAGNTHTQEEEKVPGYVNRAAEKEIDRLNMQGDRVGEKLDVVGLRAQALSILNHRLKNGAKTYASLEAGVWEYQFVFDGKMSDPGAYKGVWIDFKDDHTYDYGTRSNLEGSGRYNFHLDRGELLMVDNHAGRRPQEFNIKLQNDVLVMIGTSLYGDRNTQMKLDKTTEAIKG